MEYYNSTCAFTVKNSEELLKAIEEIKELRRGGILQPIRIRMHGGIYNLIETLVLDNDCVGITFEPYGREKVVISGGRQIKGFKKDVYCGTECYSAEIYDIKEGKFDFTDFYVDEKRADFTRYPEEGYIKAQTWENPATDLCAPSNWITGAPEELKDAIIDDHSILSFYHLWVDEHARVTDFNKETGRIDFTPKSGFRIGDMVFCLENVPQSLKKPNEWYLDRKAGKVYYVPANKEQTPENISAFAPNLHTIIKIQGKSGDEPTYDIRFKNITFAHTTGDRKESSTATDAQAAASAGGAIEMEYARGCTIEDTKITCFGRYGVFVSVGCHDILIQGCEISEGGAGGVRINGALVTDDPKKYTSHVKVTETVITRCGRRYGAGCGVLIMNASSCEVSHCDIHDLYYSGVSAGWTWGYAPNNTAYTRITDNHIWDIGQTKLSDMGGVYLLGKQEGTIVSGNLIHDVQAREYGGWALYTDEGSSYITMENNVCYRTFDFVYHQHYGSMNTIRNNIFAYGGEGVTRITRPEDHLSIIFENCILYSDNRPIFAGTKDHFENGRAAFRDCVIWDEKSAPNCGIYAGKDTYSEYFTPEECQEKKFFFNCVTADPGFADPKNGDFTLPDDSPIYQTGFRPIDISRAGVRHNIYKK